MYSYTKTGGLFINFVIRPISRVSTNLMVEFMTTNVIIQIVRNML